ncbi:hypothetical protein V6N12_014028 [Hibiscus sabdariffa]|uniref:Uncharacterized protein n=1 Tax=Hibiscus sabdariffa TaxID=183260 RepID=A0ABR2CY28_9ROSI
MVCRSAFDGIAIASSIEDAKSESSLSTHDYTFIKTYQASTKSNSNARSSLQDIPLLLHQEAKELDPKSDDKKTVESY